LPPRQSIQLSLIDSAAVTKGQKAVLAVYDGVASTHPFWSFFSIGAFARIPFRKRLCSSILVDYSLVFLWGVGMVLTAPFTALPLLVVFYPVHAVLREPAPSRGPVGRVATPTLGTDDNAEVGGQNGTSGLLSDRGGVELLNRYGESSIDRQGAFEKCFFHSLGII